MSSYLFAVLGASTACPGCLCRDRVRRYPSDLSDAQWKILEPQARQVMDQLRRATGRPMVHDLRAMLDAIGYVTRQGIEWRALPVDFPPWEAVYAFFQRWSERQLPHLLVDRLRARLRTGVGRDVQPTAAIIDSQSVKAADTVGQPPAASTTARRHPMRKGCQAVSWRVGSGVVGNAVASS